MIGEIKYFFKENYVNKYYKIIYKWKMFTCSPHLKRIEVKKNSKIPLPKFIYER